MIGMYDEPVAVPILDLLDSLMMALYLSAAKEQYNKALEDLEKFAKEFGDLYSPSDNLNKAWYDNTRGRINNTINYLYQNGIDPFRSAEGRSIIAKAVRETPYAQLAKWKKEAENMNTYQKAAAAMVADGKLNLDLLDWLMKKQGLDYNKFDPYNDSWNTLSPTKMDSLEDLTKLNFSMLKPSDLTKEQVEAMGYKYDPMNDYTGITNLMLIDTAGQSIPNVMSSANGEYYYDKAKRELQLSGISNPTDDLIKSQLQNTVAGLWSGKVAIDHSPNQFRVMDYKQRLENAAADKQFLRQVQLAGLLHQMTMEEKGFVKDRNGNWVAPGGTSSNLLLWDTRSLWNSQLVLADKMSNIGLNLNKILNYWKVRYNNTSDKKWKLYALEHYNWWSNVINEANKDGNALVKYGLVTKDGLFTNRYTNAFAYANSTQGIDYGTNLSLLIKKADEFYSNYSYKPQSGSAEHKVMQDVLAGTSTMTNIPGMANKHRLVLLNSNDIVYTPYRRVKVSGNHLFRKNSIYSLFSRWLKSGRAGSGALVNQDVTIARIPKKNGQGSYLDVSGRVSITANLFDKFCNEIGYTSDKDKQSVALQLGLIAYDAKSKLLDGTSKWSNAAYYLIPMTRTIDNKGGFAFRDINNMINKEEYGASNSYKLSVDAQNSSLQDR